MKLNRAELKNKYFNLCASCSFGWKKEVEIKKKKEKRKKEQQNQMQDRWTEEKTTK